MIKLHRNYFTLENIVYFLLCVLMADCCIFGAGKTIAIGPVGFRMALAGILVVLSIPLFVTKFRTFLSNKFLWGILLFVGWLVVQVVTGILNGNNLSVLLSDLKGFAYFALMLPVLCVLTETNRIKKLMKVMMYSSVVLAVVGIVLLCIYNWCPSVYKAFYKFDNQHYISAFASVSKNILRIFFKSSNYLLCGCAFPLYFVLVEKNEKSIWQYSAIIGLSLFMLLLTYTRSIYLAMVFAAGAVVFLCICYAGRKNMPKLVKCLELSIVFFMLLLIVFNMIMNTNYLTYAFDRLGVSFVEIAPDTITETAPDTNELQGSNTVEKFQEATIQSDQLRQATTNELIALIVKSPIVGHGLGKTLTVRESGYNEYFYLDLVVKTGIVGLVLYLMPFVLMIFQIAKWNIIITEDRLVAGLWFSILTGFMVFSYFNPYMNASLGISFYCCTIGIFDRVLKTEKTS